MKRIVLCVAMLALLISNYAYATTYTYTAPNFTTVQGVYTTSMKITGTVVTSSPVPPNSTDFDITPILTSWSFNDGVNTISSSNGELFPYNDPTFSTDAEGNITDYFFTLVDSPLGTVIGDLNDFIGVVSGSNQAYVDFVCNHVNTGGFCDSWSNGGSYASVSRIQGEWVTSDLPSTPIPTMTQWSLMLLALMLGMVGIARVRRQV